MSEPLVSVVIVTFESQDDISDCIRSVFESDISLELIVVDNSSSDRTVDRVVEITLDRPQCTLIRNSANLGFAKAVNQGIIASRGQYVLALNPDAILQRDTIRVA